MEPLLKEMGKPLFSGHHDLLWEGWNGGYAESLQYELILDGECEVGTTVSPPGDITVRPSHGARTWLTVDVQ